MVCEHIGRQSGQAIVLDNCAAFTEDGWKELNVTAKRIREKNHMINQAFLLRSTALTFVLMQALQMLQAATIEQTHLVVEIGKIRRHIEWNAVAEGNEISYSAFGQAIAEAVMTAVLFGQFILEHAHSTETLHVGHFFGGVQCTRN